MIKVHGGSWRGVQISQGSPVVLEALGLIAEQFPQPPLMPPSQRTDKAEEDDGGGPRDRPPFLGRLDALGRVGAENDVRAGVVGSQPQRYGDLGKRGTGRGPDTISCLSRGIKRKRREGERQGKEGKEKQRKQRRGRTRQGHER